MRGEKGEKRKNISNKGESNGREIKGDANLSSGCTISTFSQQISQKGAFLFLTRKGGKNYQTGRVREERA